jgi:uncharacterized membrane protein SirB2
MIIRISEKIWGLASQCICEAAAANKTIKIEVTMLLLFARMILKSRKNAKEMRKVKKITIPVMPKLLWTIAMIISESHSWAVQERGGER